ncbi:MAG: glycoside hydrolase family 31 protein [Cyanobacteriota bacterium]
MRYKFLEKINKIEKIDNGFNFYFENSLLSLIILDNDIIRVRFTNEKEFEQDFSYAVIKKFSKLDFEYQDDNNFFIIKTNKLKIIIEKEPFKIIFKDLITNEIISEDDFSIGFQGQEIQTFKKIAIDEKFFGLGEKTGNLNKKGSFYKMWNTDYPFYNYRQDPLYVSIPFFVGIKDNKSYGYFLDNTSETFFNMGASQDRYYSFGVKNGELNYYFFYGKDISEIVEKYTDLTGKNDMPPIWSLGYQQCRWSYYPDSNVKNIINTFRTKDIPIDVIYLDIDWMEDYRVFSWSKKHFPNPEKTLKELEKLNIKTVVILDPGIKDDKDYFVCDSGIKADHFVKYPDGEFYKGEVWPSWSYFPDFTKKETRFWWGNFVDDLKKQGVNGFWNDMNEPAVWGQAFPDIVEFEYEGLKKNHKSARNIYGMQMAKASYEGAKRDGKRSLIVTRAAYAGIQRYASIWTGDNQSTEEDMLLNTIMIQNLGISGVSFVGNDVGGFGGDASKELFAKWIQLGVFTPFFRTHSMKNTKNQEPWSFGEDVEENVREYIKLRYKLLPYLYSCFYESHIKGTPIVKPLFWFNQNDEKTYLFPYQFYFGNNIMVALNKPNQDYVSVYLPEGKWIDFYDNIIFEGKQEIVVKCGWKKLPIFIKMDSIIPMIKEQSYSSMDFFKEVELHVYVEKKAEFLFYEDDGDTYDYEKGNFILRNIIVEKDDDKIKTEILEVNKSKYISKISNFKIIEH